MGADQHSSIEHEQGGLSQSMDSVLVTVSKFGNQQPVVPVIPAILSLIHKEVQELFDLLVDTFGLAIHLQVICHGGCNFNPKYLTEPTHEV